MIGNEIKAAYNHTKWSVALRGLFAILIGVVILTRPIASVAALALVIALWALIEGVVAIMHGFELRSTATHWWWVLLGGVVSVVFGMAAIYDYPGLSLAFVVVWVSWWLISAGVMAAYVAVVERKMGVSWGWTMAWAVLAIVGGILAFMNPDRTLASLLALLAGFGIVGGVLRLIVAFRMNSVQKETRHTMDHPVRA